MKFRFRSFKTIQCFNQAELVRLSILADLFTALRCFSCASNALFSYILRFRFLLASDARPRIRFALRKPFLPRKEVIQPHLPIRLPCYDFTPVIGLTFDSCLRKVSSLASGAPNSHGVTGGVYKARERIHRGILIRDY